MHIKLFKHIIFKYILFLLLLLKGVELFANQCFYNEKIPIEIALLSNDINDYDSIKDGKYDNEICCDEIKNTCETVLFCSWLHLIGYKKNNYCSVYRNSSIHCIEYTPPSAKERL